MTIRECIELLKPTLGLVVPGVPPETIHFPDGAYGLKFPCPICSATRSTDGKKRQKCARIFQGALLPSGYRRWWFQCARCQEARIPFLQFLEHRYPAISDSYVARNSAGGRDFKPRFS